MKDNRLFLTHILERILLIEEFTNLRNVNPLAGRL